MRICLGFEPECVTATVTLNVKCPVTSTYLVPCKIKDRINAVSRLLKCYHCVCYKIKLLAITW